MQFTLLQRKYHNQKFAHSLKIRDITQKSRRNYEMALKGNKMGGTSPIFVSYKQTEMINVSSLFCTRIQKTVDALGRIKSKEDQKETILSITMNLEDMCRQQRYQRIWWEPK